MGLPKVHETPTPAVSLIPMSFLRPSIFARSSFSEGSVDTGWKNNDAQKGGEFLTDNFGASPNRIFAFCHLGQVP